MFHGRAPVITEPHIHVIAESHLFFAKQNIFHIFSLIPVRPKLMNRTSPENLHDHNSKMTLDSIDPSFETKTRSYRNLREAFSHSSLSPLHRFNDQSGISRRNVCDSAFVRGGWMIGGLWFWIHLTSRLHKAVHGETQSIHKKGFEAGGTLSLLISNYWWGSIHSHFPQWVAVHPVELVVFRRCRTSGRTKAWSIPPNLLVKLSTLQVQNQVITWRKISECDVFVGLGPKVYLEHCPIVL